jgi:four helix bundle protein
MEDGTKISSFENLRVWQEAQAWAVQTYTVSKQFPKDETYGLTSQLRRAVSSISANIAEGFGRKSSKDKLHFYVIAYGSALETKNFLYLAEKLGYLEAALLADLLRQGTSVQKLLNAFMRPLREL